MIQTYICKICKHESIDPIREYRATEKIYSCPKCGRLILREHFPLAAIVTPQGVILNV